MPKNKIDDRGYEYITLYVPKQDAQKLRKLAIKENRTLTNYLRILLSNHLDKKAGK